MQGDPGVGLVIKVDERVVLIFDNTQLFVDTSVLAENGEQFGQARAGRQVADEQLCAVDRGCVL